MGSFDINSIKDLVDSYPGLRISFDVDMHRDETIIRIETLHFDYITNQRVNNWRLKHEMSGTDAFYIVKKHIDEHLQGIGKTRPISIIPFNGRKITESFVDEYPGYPVAEQIKKAYDEKVENDNAGIF